MYVCWEFSGFYPPGSSRRSSFMRAALSHRLLALSSAMRFLFTFVFTYEDDSSRLKHQNSSLGNLFVYPPRS